MALYVNTNVAALSGQRNLANVTNRMNSSFEKLSSGSRINSARDDAAGLQIADRLTTQINGLNQATRNANDGISIAQIAEGALGEITNNIQRVRQLVVQGGNRTLSGDDRSALAQEFTKLLNVNNDIAERTSFGSIKLLNDDSPESGFQIQSGAFSGEQSIVTTGNAKLTSLFGKIVSEDDHPFPGDTLSDISDHFDHVGTLGELVAIYMVTNNVDATNAADALFGSDRSGRNIDFGKTSVVAQLHVSALATILESEPSTSDVITVTADRTTAHTMLSLADPNTSAYSDEDINKANAYATDLLLEIMSGTITQVDKQRAKLGAEQNGLTSTISSNITATVNVSDSRARIQDTDFAAETAELTRNQIIQQAATTILSQSNQLPQTALVLLR